jgi:hypothetical protein
LTSARYSVRDLLAFGPATDAAHLGTERDVVEDCAPGKERERLENTTPPSSGPGPFTAAAADEDFAAGGGMKPAIMLRSVRLAASRRADDGHELARRHLQRQDRAPRSRFAPAWRSKYVFERLRIVKVLHSRHQSPALSVARSIGARIQLSTMSPEKTHSER